MVPSFTQRLHELAINLLICYTPCSPIIFIQLHLQWHFQPPSSSSSQLKLRRRGNYSSIFQAASTQIWVQQKAGVLGLERHLTVDKEKLRLQEAWYLGSHGFPERISTCIRENGSFWVMVSGSAHPFVEQSVRRKTSSRWFTLSIGTTRQYSSNSGL